MNLLQILDRGFASLVCDRSDRSNIRSALASQPLETSCGTAHLLPFIRIQQVFTSQTTFLDLSIGEVLHKVLLGDLQNLFVLLVSHAGDFFATIFARFSFTDTCDGAPLKHLFHDVNVEGRAIAHEEVVHMDDEHRVQVSTLATVGEEAGVHLEM